MLEISEHLRNAHQLYVASKHSLTLFSNLRLNLLIQNKRTKASISQVGLEPTIPVFQPEKTVHASDRAATVIGIGRQILYTLSYKEIQMYTSLLERIVC
jgi:hypothetical protein